ncbi:MAG TPA: L-histidine N(alpha)-methyltransferase, partial [Novosphingobium sp.]
MSACAPVVDSPFARDVVAGLSRPQKLIPARYFYDLRGSELFEEITRLPEYYPTRTELALLESRSTDLARLAGEGRTVVEFGAGSVTKTPVLLDALAAQTFVGIDISGEFLEQSLMTLARSRPGLRVVPVQADFTLPLDLPRVSGPLTGYFSGSTIGNFTHRAAVDLLRSFRATLGADARLVIAMDTRKNPRLLEAAYDDAAGVTAQFNLNLLVRINRELDATIPVDAFDHRAAWHDGYGRIEMHLVATRDMTFRVAGRTFAMRRGETIHTENSYKYTLPEARLMARASGWEPLACWTDPAELF